MNKQEKKSITLRIRCVITNNCINNSTLRNFQRNQFVCVQREEWFFDVFLKAEKLDLSCLTEIKDVLPQAEYHIPLKEHNVEDMHTENTQEGNIQKYKQLFSLQGKTLSAFIFNFLLIYIC